MLIHSGTANLIDKSSLLTKNENTYFQAKPILQGLLRRNDTRTVQRVIKALLNEEEGSLPDSGNRFLHLTHQYLKNLVSGVTSHMDQIYFSYAVGL